MKGSDLFLLIGTIWIASVPSLPIFNLLLGLASIALAVVSWIKGD